MVQLQLPQQTVGKLSRSDRYIMDVTQELTSNTKAVLVGHGIKSSILNIIATRPDIQSKLAAICYNTKMRGKGAAGLKKTNNFKITAYPNFGTFNINARADVEKFMAGLSPKDSDIFNNSEDIAVIIALPDAPTGDISTDIKTGQSILRSFNTAIRSEQKTIGGIYIAVFMAPSIEGAKGIKYQPVSDEVSTEATELAAKKAARKKMRRLNRSYNNINNQISNLQRKRQLLGIAAKQYDSMTSKYGKDFLGDFESMDIEADYYKDARDKAYKAANWPDRKLAKAYTDLPLKDRRVKDAWLRRNMKSKELADLLIQGDKTRSAQLLDKRTSPIKSKIKILRIKNNQLTSIISDAETSGDRKNMLKAQRALKSNNIKIKSLRAKLGTYADLSPEADTNRIIAMKEITDKMDALRAKGATIKQAIDKALASSTQLSNSEKQVIQQQIYQQVAEGTPATYAAQQTIQDLL